MLTYGRCFLFRQGLSRAPHTLTHLGRSRRLPHVEVSVSSNRSFLRRRTTVDSRWFSIGINCWLMLWKMKRLRIPEGPSSAMDGLGSVTTVTAVLLVLGYLSNFLYNRYQLHATRRAFVLKHGCRPPTSIIPGLDPFGFRFMYWLLDAGRKHEVLPFFCRLFNKYGKTCLIWNFRGMRILTCEAENVKAILSTRFEDWCV